MADCKNYKVNVTQIGRNACGFNGLALERDLPVTMKHGDRIEILLGQYIHMIEFDPAPPSSSNNKQSADLFKPLNAISDSEDEEPEPKKTKKDNTLLSKNWEAIDGGELLIYTPEGIKPSNLIAAYDLDGTIIGTTTNSVFPKHKDDWKILYPEILTKLKDLHDRNYRIVFFTNQAGISTRKTNTADFKKKIENIIKKIQLPIQVFIATNYSFYRKPCTGMWDALMERNKNMKIDMSKSFYCGDAAGREAGQSHKKKDFSQTDLLFAKNLNLNFETPEYHFLKEKMPLLKIAVFDPNAIPCDIPLCEPSWGQVIATKIEVVVLVGLPGSGKSTFAKSHLVPAGYFHVNRDTLGTWNKCVAEMEQALRAKRKVVIDNTNPDAESRRRFIEVAKNYTSIVRCFIMNTSFQHVRHNNKVSIYIFRVAFLFVSFC